jgi:hypothetical protein
MSAPLAPEAGMSVSWSGARVDIGETKALYSFYYIPIPAALPSGFITASKLDQRGPVFRHDGANGHPKVIFSL